MEQALRPRVDPDTTITGSELSEIADALRRALPGTVKRDVVFESVRHLVGRKLTAYTAAKLAWRLAGNLARLKAGESVRPWVGGLSGPEYLPLEAIKATPLRDARNRLGYELSFMVLAGTPAAEKVSRYWTNAQVRWVAMRIGFSAPWGKYPFHKGTEIVGLRLLVRADPELSRGGVIGFTACEEQPPSFVSWNRKEVLRFRMHIEPCPNGWTHPCRNCAVGYEECRASVHLKTYEQRWCPECQSDAAFFDPELLSHKCVSCTHKERMKRR